MPDIIDQLTDSQLDRLQQRLTARATARAAERAAAERDRTDPRPLRPQIGDGGRMFGDARSRQTWDRECLAALQSQRVRFAVAPGCSVLARDGSRLGAGAELSPSEHLDARLGSQTIQAQRLVEQGYVLARETL
jgi:hypothetical protein